MAADYLKLGFSDSLAKALERRDQRNERFNANIDDTLSGIGEATKMALQQRQRNKILEQYVGDENDQELKMAKEAYRTSGDPSLLIQYEQNRKQDAITRKANETSALAAKNAKEANEIEKQKLSNQRRLELVGRMNSAKASIDDASAGGKEPTNALKTAYKDARAALEYEFPEVAKDYELEYNPAKVAITANESMNIDRKKFMKDLIQKRNNGVRLTDDEVAELLTGAADLYERGLPENEYEEIYKSIISINRDYDKAANDAAKEAMSEQRGEVAYQQGQSDRKTAKAKEKKAEQEEKDKKDAERKKGQNWLDARGNLSDDELKQNLAFASADIQAAVNAIKGW